MKKLDPTLLGFWRRAIDSLDPLRPLRSSEVDSLYQVRPDGPAASVAVRFLRSMAPEGEKVLLYGARGAGKSTELSMLARTLHEEYAVVQVDLGAGLPDRANTLAVVTLLGAAALCAIRSWQRPDADLPAIRRAAYEKVAGGFGQALQRIGLAADLASRLAEVVAPVVSAMLPQATLLAPAIGTLGAARGVLSQAADLRRELSREPLGGRLPANRLDDAEAVVTAVNESLQELRELSGRPPLLLADGFDKRTDLDDIRLALSDAELLVAIRAPLVLTGPVLLRHDASFREIERSFSLASLPNVAVRRLVGGAVETDPTGVALLVELLDKRLRAARLPADLAAPAAVELAAVMSSGIVREFLELLCWAGDLALAKGTDRIGEHDVRAAVRRRRLSLQGYLDETDVGILERIVHKPWVLPAAPRADVLLFENLIACYSNGDIWYRPHEAIADSISAALGDG